MKSIYRTVGENTRARRLRLGLTLEDLAELSGLHASYIGQIERDAKKTSLETIAMIAAALDVPPHRLLELDRAKRSRTPVVTLAPFLRLNTIAERKLILSVARHLSKNLRRRR